MSTHYLAWSPDQPNLLPASPSDWMSPDHLAYQVRDVVVSLDITAITNTKGSETRGAAGFDPRMIVSILLYAWGNRVYSSRRIARLCADDLGGRYLAAGHMPDFRVISRFQLVHGDALADLFIQSVRLCQAAGMVSLNMIAADGMRLEANASKHKAMSYARMVEREAELRREIARIQQLAREEDAREDSLFGKDNPGPDVPAELKLREGRLKKLLEAKQALEAEARAAAEAKAAQRDANKEETGKEPPGRKPPPPGEAKPKPGAQRNFTDPESRIMKTKDGFTQGYNAQAAVDADHQVIVAADLTNQAADAPHLIPLLEQVQHNTDAVPAVTLSDAGYFSASNVETAAASSTFCEVYIPPDRIRHGSGNTRKPAPDAQIADEDLSPADRMRRRLATPRGHEAYRQRKKIVEPVFGQIQGCPGSPGKEAVLRRGLAKAKQEWLMACATHNLLKYIRYKCACKTAEKATNTRIRAKNGAIRAVVRALRRELDRIGAGIGSLRQPNPVPSTLMLLRATV